MKRFRLIFGATALISGLALADDQPLDVTIQVLDSPAALPYAVTKTLQLPPSVPESAKAPVRSRHGLETANEARADGRQAGQDIAEKAKAKHSNPPAGPGSDPLWTGGSGKY